MGNFHDYESLVALVAREGVVRRTVSQFDMDIAGGCQSPKIVELFGRPTQWSHPDLQEVPKAYRKVLLAAKVGFEPTQVKGFQWSKGDNHPLWLHFTIRCRRCEWCLRQRAKLWANKAQDEIARASRTWFCTFTLSPDEHFRVESLARVADAENGEVFEARDEQSQFRARCDVLSPEITRYVKRVRKESGAPLRYLFVTEKHKTGLPHFHALFHEVNPAMPLRKAVLKGQWKLGFSRFKLVETPSAAWYLCKYLSKEQATRVRSSLKYGKFDLDRSCVSSVKRDPKGGRLLNQLASTLSVSTEEAPDGIPGRV